MSICLSVCVCLCVYLFVCLFENNFNSFLSGQSHWHILSVYFASLPCPFFFFSECYSVEQFFVAFLSHEPAFLVCYHFIRDEYLCPFYSNIFCDIYSPIHDTDLDHIPQFTTHYDHCPEFSPSALNHNFSREQCWSARLHRSVGAPFWEQNTTQYIDMTEHATQ